MGGALILGALVVSTLLWARLDNMHIWVVLFVTIGFGAIGFADDYANMEKGSGCVKITPAHDFNDYDVGQRHSLPMINMLTTNGDIREYPECVNSDGSDNNELGARPMR